VYAFFSDKKKKKKHILIQNSKKEVPFCFCMMARDKYQTKDGGRGAGIGHGPPSIVQKKKKKKLR
jgi:hypothetical protein